MASVFTKIIQGELPSYKIWENELVIAFLAIDPITPGHTLVVPKVEIDHYMDVPSDSFQEVFRASQFIGRAIREATGCRRVTMAVQGFEVPHFHLHLIPANGAEDFDFKKAKRRPEAEMKAVQAKIIAKLKV